MLVVGLTGNYGMGKSLVLRVFRELGAETVDADAVVAGLLEDPHVVGRIRGLLGPDVVDSAGHLIKKKVSELIFKDETLRLQVEDILHPLVFEHTDHVVSTTSREMVVVEVPLMFERGYQNRFSKTITVHTDEDTALERLVKSGVPRADALRRIFWQMPIEDKKHLADYLIDNSGTEEETRAQADRIYRELQATGDGD